MRTQTLLVHSALIAATIAVVNVGVTSSAAACSCVAPTVESSYNSSTDVATIDIRRQFVIGSTRYYQGRVQRTFKGCLQPSAVVFLRTPVSSATCGALLALQQPYLINGNDAGTFLGVPMLSISLCSYNIQVSALTDHDRAFLEGRTVCCGDACTCADGTQPVNCFADPCSVAPACAEGKCVANYCGGCNAEFYDAGGNAVCQNPPSGCKTDADCGTDQWCRQAKSDGTTPLSYECVPFVGEGASCDGFTIPWLYERCEPGLTCDTPDFVADASGICRRSCASNDDCKGGQYCASDKLCDDDGTCEREVDCNLPGNDYAHIECVGHGTCGDDRRCGWTCAAPECVDLAGLNFGPCDAVLGWGVQAGRCTQLSGCDAGGFKLFATGEECRKACTPECSADAECMRTGCSGQICAASDVITTCQFLPEYACYGDPAITQCGCNAGQCGWAQTTQLQACLASGGPTTP